MRASLRQLMFQIGGYSEYEFSRLESERRVVFVCAGNVCRSPYAEYRAREMGMNAASAGLMVENSCSPPREALLCARKRGLNLSGHSSRSLRDIDLRRNDVIAVMEPWQAGVVREQIMLEDIRITLLGLWSADSIASIPDPMGSNEQTFSACFDFIDKSIESMSQASRE